MQGHRDLRRILEYIYEMRGIDFARYRQATLLRRLDLRLQETGCSSYRKYADHLRSNPDELSCLLSTLTIKVSKFFRNPVVFEILSSTVLPGLVAEFGALRVWSIGCANGEEPYSVAMIVDDLIASSGTPLKYHIKGTDVDPDAVAKARLGEYSEDDLIETKRKFIDAYFTRKSGMPGSEYGRERYILSKKIRSMVEFSSGNIMDLITSEKVRPGSYNLILCRNILIYFNREMQEAIISSLRNIIHDSGYLVIGESETIPDRHGFEQPFQGIKIFRKQSSAAAC